MRQSRFTPAELRQFRVRNKYGVAAVGRRQLDGVTFASLAEMQRYKQLRTLARAGAITDLVLQPRFPLVVAGITVATYVADFAYTESDGRRIVEDVKGVVTAVFRLKRKLMRACLGIEVLVTGANP